MFGVVLLAAAEAGVVAGAEGEEATFLEFRV